jgi:hypothetical protein
VPLVVVEMRPFALFAHPRCCYDSHDGDDA